MDFLQVTVYTAAVLLAGLTIGLTQRLIRLTGRKHFQALMVMVITGSLVAFLDLVFRYFPFREARSPFYELRVSLDMLLGFLIIPVMMAFIYFFIVFLNGMAGTRTPALVRGLFAAYWGLFFAGFIIAEVRYFTSGDRDWTVFMNPFFNLGIVGWGLIAIIKTFVASRRIRNPESRRQARVSAAFFLVSFVLIFGMNSESALFSLKVDLITRSLVGLAYILPFLVWLNIRTGKMAGAFPREPAEAETLEEWFKARGISPREREILLHMVQGKSNRSIAKELFISRRTVETHVQNAFRKLQVNSRVQLVRMAFERALRPGSPE